MVFFVLIYKFKNNTIPSEEIMTVKLHMPRHWCRELTCKILFARGHVRTVTRVIVIREYVLYMLTRGEGSSRYIPGVLEKWVHSITYGYLHYSVPKIYFRILSVAFH